MSGMFKKWFGKGEKQEAPKEEGPGEDPPQEDRQREEPRGEETAASEPPERSKPRGSLFSRALAKTRKGLKSIFTLRRALDEGVVNEIEAELYAADFGPEAVGQLLNGPDGIRAAWKERKIEHADQVRDFLKVRLKQMLKKRPNQLVTAPTPPTVILVSGVNGTGKTTSIAKLSGLLRKGGSSVVLAACDTFRAAAVEQLTIWSRRLEVEIVTGAPGADPASVAYRSAEAALEKKADYLIVDTAGRLHTQKNLMRELGKIRTVLSKKIPGSPHECLLVLDATTGQNALSQAKAFQDEVQVTGIILAKLDGTAKGGIVVTIWNRLDIPVKLIGVGETIEDIEVFDPDQFVEALFEE